MRKYIEALASKTVNEVEKVVKKEFLRKFKRTLELKDAKEMTIATLPSGEQQYYYKNTLFVIMYPPKLDAPFSTEKISSTFKYQPC